MLPCLLEFFDTFNLFMHGMGLPTGMPCQISSKDVTLRNVFLSRR